MKNIFDSKVWTFFVALALSVLIWLFVRGELEIKEIIEVDLIYKRNTQVVALSPKPRALRVEVRGAAALVHAFSQKEHALEVIYAQEPVGKLIRGNLESELRRDFPNEIEIVRIDPRELQVELDAYATKTIPLATDLQGSLADGFEIESVKIQPERVLFGGAKSKLNAHETFLLPAIDLREVTGDYTRELSISPKGDADVWPIKQEMVRVQIKIREKTIQKELKIPIAFDGGTLQATVSPPNISVKVEGPFTQVNALTPEDFKVYLEPEGLRAGLYRRAVAMRVPEGIVLIDNHPRYFSIRVW